MARLEAELAVARAEGKQLAVSSMAQTHAEIARLHLQVESLELAQEESRTYLLTDLLTD